MSLRIDLLQQLRDFDEAALVALANAGLLRRARKDLERGEPTVLIDRSDAFEVQWSEQRVVFASGDVRSGRCDCRAASRCHHWLAVVLWLWQRRESEQAAGASAPTDAAAPTPAIDPLGDLCERFDLGALRRYAGSRDWRTALALALQSEHARDLQVEVTSYPILRLPRRGFTLRCLGTQLADFVPHPLSAESKRLAVLALLLLRQRLGRPIEPIEARAAADPAVEAGTTVDPRQRLLESIRRFAEDRISVGLSHAAPEAADLAEALATWAQGLGYIQFARSLTRISEFLDALRTRQGQADEALLFDELALLNGRTAALSAARQQGLEPAALVGRARQRYDESADLDVVGLAAWPWRSVSGYHGLSVLLYAPGLGEFLSWSDARPLSVTFDPIARLTSFGPWQGLANPRQMLAQRLRLSMPRLSVHGRISGHEATCVIAARTARFAELPGVVDDFRSLVTSANTPASLLSENLEPRFVLLAPVAWRAEFDAASQTLSWRLIDASGAEVELCMPYSALDLPAIERIEALASGKPEDRIVVARHEFRPTPRLTPLGMLSRNGEHLDCHGLHFTILEDAAAPVPNAAPVPVAAMERDWTLEPREFTAPDQTDRDLQARWRQPPAALRDWDAAMQALAQRGTSSRSTRLAEDLTARFGSGLLAQYPPMSDLLHVPDTDAAQVLLRLRLLWLQWRHQLEGDMAGSG